MASRTGLTLLRNARGGDPQAQLALGQVYLTGEHGLGKSPATAYHWLEMAARAGLQEAWTLIGAQIPLEALKDAEGALPWYRRAAAAGVAPAQRTVAVRLLERAGAQEGDPYRQAESPAAQEAIALLNQAAARGDMQAQEILGEFHFSGRHVPKDRVLARAWLERAAAQGSSGAQRQLISLCAGERDLAGVERHARALAQQGEAYASYALGMALLGRVPLPAPPALQHAQP